MENTYYSPNVNAACSFLFSAGPSLMFILVIACKPTHETSSNQPTVHTNFINKKTTFNLIIFCVVQFFLDRLSLRSTISLSQATIIPFPHFDMQEVILNLTFFLVVLISSSLFLFFASKSQIKASQICNSILLQ